MTFKEYDNAYSVFNETSDQIGYFEDVAVAVKSEVNGSRRQHLNNKVNAVKASSTAAGEPLNESLPLNGYHNNRPEGSGHFAQSSILFQPPPHPNLPIARKSRAVVVEENGESADMTTPVFQATTALHHTPSTISTARDLLLPAWERSSLPSQTATEPAWYDGNSFTCLQCGYSSRRQEQYDGHVRAQHHTEPADFAAYTEKGSCLYRCQCCLTEIIHELTNIRHQVHT